MKQRIKNVIKVSVIVGIASALLYCMAKFPLISGDCTGKIVVFGFHNPIYNFGCILRR
jgi:hypothetical protein